MSVIDVLEISRFTTWWRSCTAGFLIKTLKMEVLHAGAHQKNLLSKMKQRFHSSSIVIQIRGFDLTRLLSTQMSYDLFKDIFFLAFLLLLDFRK